MKENPFYVLELGPTASPEEIVRQASKLQGMLSLGLKSARLYSTPLGEYSRTEESVRLAAETLEDPLSRLVWELWSAERAPLDAPEGLRNALAHHFLAQGWVQSDGNAPDESYTVAQFDELGLAWDDALQCPDLVLLADKRAVALRFGNAEKVLTAFRESIVLELVVLVSRMKMDLDDLRSSIATEAASRYAEEVARSLELSCERWVQTAKTQRDRRTGWRGIKEQYRSTCFGRGIVLRTVAFETVNVCLSRFAVTVYDDGDYELAEELFRWMHDEADAVGDDETSRMQGDNLRLAQDAQAQVAQEIPRQASLRRRLMALTWLAVVCVGSVLLHYCSTP